MGSASSVIGAPAKANTQPTTPNTINDTNAADSGSSISLKQIDKAVIEKIRKLAQSILKKEIILRVNSDSSDKRYGIGFTTHMFRKKEWFALKRLCNQNEIYQTDLNQVFNNYLATEEAKLRNLDVAIVDIHHKFVGYSLLSQEIADIFLPQIFLKEHDSLYPPQSIDEISFARFIILGFQFCSQAIPDHIYDFFSIIKQNFHLKLITKIYTFNLHKILIVLRNDIHHNFMSIYAYLLLACNIKDDNEITIENIIKLTLKYPLLFYPIYNFRKYMKRFIFGDKFWNHRKDFPTKFPEFEEYSRSIDISVFETEATAALATARAILFDVLHSIAVQEEQRELLQLELQQNEQQQQQQQREQLHTSDERSESKKVRKRNSMTNKTAAAAKDVDIARDRTRASLSTGSTPPPSSTPSNNASTATAAPVDSRVTDKADKIGAKKGKLVSPIIPLTTSPVDMTIFHIEVEDRAAGASHGISEGLNEGVTTAAHQQDNHAAGLMSTFNFMTGARPVLQPEVKKKDIDDGNHANNVKKEGSGGVNYSLTTRQCIQLKNYLGYKSARKIIQLAGITYPNTQLFMKLPRNRSKETRGFDSKMQRDFVYDNGTGKRAWIQEVLDSNGNILRETAWQIKPKMMKHVSEEEVGFSEV